MEDYIGTGKFNIYKNYDIIVKDLRKEIKEMNLGLDFYDADDRTILDELFIYKNHPKLKSIIEIYLDTNKFRNEEKVKMLKCMKDSYVGLFKVIDVDRLDSYVTYEDVFTKKKFKVVDIALSSTYKLKNNKDIYLYNRIITYDDISFGSGIHCIMTSDNKELLYFIKRHNYKKFSDFSRCIMLYDISKGINNLVVNYHSKY